MGREIRKVPKDWEHPKDEDGHFIALYDGTFSSDAAKWDIGKSKWDIGYKDDWEGGWIPRSGEIGMLFEEWEGSRPESNDYMPEWDESEKTYIMMYETCSEGTPISPAFECPEDLAKWLADTGASSFGNRTASYDQWLSMIKAGWAPSAIATNAGMVSGVEY